MHWIKCKMMSNTGCVSSHFTRTLPFISSLMRSHEDAGRRVIIGTSDDSLILNQNVDDAHLAAVRFALCASFGPTADSPQFCSLYQTELISIHSPPAVLSAGGFPSCSSQSKDSR